jgi:hypothetical protein
MLVGVSRSGFATDGLDLAIDPAMLVAAWEPSTDFGDEPGRRRSTTDARLPPKASRKKSAG